MTREWSPGRVTVSFQGGTPACRHSVMRSTSRCFPAEGVASRLQMMEESRCMRGLANKWRFPRTRTAAARRSCRLFLARHRSGVTCDEANTSFCLRPSMPKKIDRDLVLLDPLSRAGEEGEDPGGCQPPRFLVGHLNHGTVVRSSFFASRCWPSSCCTHLDQNVDILVSERTHYYYRQY